MGKAVLLAVSHPRMGQQDTDCLPLPLALRARPAVAIEIDIALVRISPEGTMSRSDSANAVPIPCVTDCM